jgi:PAS domain S-box-containing protein
MSVDPHSPKPANDRLQALARVSALLRQELPTREILQCVITALPDIVPADAYAAWRYEQRAQQWRIVASSGLSPHYVEHVVPERHDRAPLTEPIVVEDVFAPGIAAERRSFYESEGVRAMFVVPLHIRGDSTGALTCYFRSPRTISREEQQVARILGEIVSAALSVRKFDRFAVAARVTSAELELGSIVQAVTDAATEMTNAHFGAFFYNVVGSAGESYMLYTISGVPREEFSRFPMPRNTAIFGRTFSGTGTFRSANIRKDPSYGHSAPYYGMPEGHLPVVSYLAVPVISRSGDVIGGLFFGHPEENVFSENEEQIVEALAAQAAVAIDNARLYDALQRERERLARSESRYRAIVTAAPTQQAIWVANAEGEIGEDVPALREITGQSYEELRGWGWADAIHPDDRARVDEAWRQSILGRMPMLQRYRMRTRDGAYRWFETTGVPVLGDDGSLIEWVGSTNDVHAEKTAQDSLRFLAEASDLLASSLDYETTLATVARLAVPEIADWCTVDVAVDDGTHRRLAVAHVDPSKVEMAHALRRRFPPDPRNDAVTRVIATGRSEWARHIPPEVLDERISDPEQREIMRELGLMSYIIVPLRTHDRILGTLSFILSDSRRRYSEADLAFAEELGRRAAVSIENARLYGAAQAGNQAKDEFLATLSHELRTPMTAVLGWARMLKLGLNAEESVEAVDAIERSATVQMQLIEDILDMSRIMSGKLRIQTSPVDLCAVTESALGTVRPAATAKDIEVFTSFPREVPPVLGDESRLQQIVWNLLTNAIKFTGRGGMVIVRVSSSADNVALTVRDNGAGISPRFLPHVFERFRQEDSSTTRAHGGIGLGLAIVRHLVELHGGSIRAESEGEGRGATFTVELPAMPGRTIVRSAAHAQEEWPPLDGVSILVIDDEAMTRDVVAAILRRCNATVATAESPRDAHDQLDRLRPDVILCDIAMPDHDGYDFVRELRTRDPELARIPVLALTAFGRPEDRERALSNGFDGYLNKPIDPVTLATAVRDAV